MIIVVIDEDEDDDTIMMMMILVSLRSNINELWKFLHEDEVSYIKDEWKLFPKLWC